MSTQAYYKDRLGFDPNEVYEELSDPKLHGYEESLSKFKDERDAIQKKTFTKWVNKHLKKVSKKIDDLFEDLRDGHRLISLLEVLSRERLPRERGRMRFHMLQNVQTCLDYLRFRKIKLVNIRAEDIVDGNPKLILGLIWTIILHFQISDIMVGQEESMTAREALLRWAQKTTAKYPGVRVGDFAGSWKDGLAFNAIIHRNRPDLIEWRSLRSRQVRDRLDSAFNVVEREYGVTRLLDPEDVDTPEPDEKSLITYISSLYDVFPEPPAIHPLYDPETQRKYTNYRELSKSLMSWIRHSIAVMQDRDFPPTLIEMKKLAAESARFHSDEVPTRLRDKLALFQMFKDIERFLEETGEYIEPELKPDVIERNWNQMLALHQERDGAIQEEIVRLERLQRIAEKVHRDAKQTEVKLGNLEQQIEEEARNVSRLHPADAKRHCDLISEDIDSLDDVIKSMFSDVQILKDGRHNLSAELHKRVQRIHQRWLSLRALYQSRLVTIISTLDESRTSRTTLETRLFETNEHFRHLRDCTEWVKTKLKQIDDAEYGTDLPGVQIELESYQKEQKAIERFSPSIERCSQARGNLNGEELQIYTTHLTYLLKWFSELQSKSTKRLTDLNILLDFIQSATSELIWLNEKEETEVNRDWSAKGLDLNEVEQYYEALMSELEKREIQFSSVQDRGDSLLLQHHPASKTIEAYLAAMQTQWSWVLQLTLCLEYHLRQATIYHTFFAEIKECEHWVQKQDQLLNTVYSQSEFSLDEGERLLREMQGLREDLARYGDLVQALVERSAVVPPLRLRKQTIRQPLSVTAVCNYPSVNMSVSKDEPCQLLDNVQKTKWRVVNSSGTEGLVAGVCFSIPPPDAEALDAAEKLKRQYDRCVALWQKKQLRMRQNMIFATIKVVKSWDLQQFLAMGKDQRDAIRRALNEDADKLMSEGDPNDPQLKRLAREMAEVNRLFDEFEKRAAAGEGQFLSMNEQLDSVESALNDADQTLQAKIAAPVPRDVDTLEHLVVEHRTFETEIQTIEVELNEVKVAFSQQPRKAPNNQQRVEQCVQTFDRVWQTSRIYIERLKCVEIVLGGLEEATTVVSEFEIKLASYDKMPSTIDGLKKVHEDLIDVQSSIQVQQAVIDQLNDDMQTTRRQVEKSRANLQPARATMKRHPDVDRLEADVSQVTVRWANVCSQVAERLQSVEAAGELLDKYNNQAKGTRDWVNGIEEQIMNGHAGELYNGAIERKQQIEDLNVAGGRLVREAKQAIEERYRGCAESVTSLVSWLSNIEMQLANQECIREESSDVKNQINAVKSIRDDIDGHGRQVANCVEQARQIGTQGADLLTSDEISGLDKDSRELKTRYEKADGQADKLHRKLASALDELNKYRSELSSFKNWLDKAERGADDKEKLVCNLNRQQSATEATRDFVSDVIAHQADLRFISMAAQKFSDECKEYTGVMNDYRTSLPHRLQPVEVSDSLVRAEVNQAGVDFQDLMKRATKLQDKVANVGAKQKEYQDALQKAKSWLKDVENKTAKVLNEPLGSEPKVVEDQLSRAKTLNAEFLNNVLIDNANQATANLLRAIEMELPENEKAAVESAPKDLESKFVKLAGGLQDKCKMLENALLQSQGVQEALDTLAGWLTNAENQSKNLTKPASLSSERLAEQLREHRLLAVDVSSHVPSFESVNRSASDLISNPENARIARKIDTRMKELNSRFEKLQDKVEKRSQLLEEVSVSLEGFVRVEVRYEEWYTEVIEIFETTQESQVLATKIDDISRQRDAKREDVDELIRTGKNLVAKKDVTDTQPVKDKLKTVEAQWKDLNDLIDENQRDGKARSEQLQAYERLRTQVTEWLVVIETRVERFEAVAVDADAVKRQNEELKPIAKEHRDFAPSIDKVVEIGTAYDSLARAERGDTLRRRSSVTPLKRTSLSGSYASPVQTQLNDIVNRYTSVGTKLTDRQVELDSMKDEAKKHAEALKVLVSTLDRLERQMPKDSHVPPTKEEADKLLKNVKNLLEDMFDKQPQLDALKNQVADLIRRKPDVPGIITLQESVDSVGARWKDLMDRIKARSTLLDQAKEFQDLCDQLTNWLQSKDKMMGVLGPVASDPRLVHNQLQQVQVLYDELKEQERNVNNLDTLLNTLMASTNPASNEARKIQEKVGLVNKKWTDLIGRLEDRRRQLDAASGMSKQFAANLSKLLEALQKISDETDDLSVLKGDVEDALTKINALEDRLGAERPLLAEVESTGNELCHILSDSGSMADVTSKIQQVDKTYGRVQKKLDNKKAELESQIKDTREFVDACEAIQEWIKDYGGVVSEKLEVSADRDTLKQQVADFEPIYKEVMSKEHEVIMMLNRGQELLQNSKKADAKQQLKALENIRAEWEKVKSSTVEKKTRLEKAHQMCKKYYVTLESFFPWLEEVEVKISQMEPVALKKQELEKQIKDLSAFKNEISRHSGGYDGTKSLGESFLTTCDVHKEGVKEDLSAVKQRWEALNGGVQERAQMLDDFLSRLGDFNDQLRDVEHILQRCEDRLASHDALGEAARDPKLLERIKALLDEAKSLEKKLSPLQKLAEALVNDAYNHGSDASHVADQAEGLIGRYKDLRGQLEERCSALEVASQAVAHFTEQLKSALSDLSTLEHELDSMTPAARELTLLQTQLDTVAIFFGRLEQYREHLEVTCRAGEELIGQGREAQSSKEQISNIMKQITKLEDRAKTRDEDLEKVFVKLENFYEHLDQIMGSVEEATKEENQFKAVSAEVEVIRQQQEEFKSFCNEHRDALGKDVVEANKAGQGLVQSAASGVSTVTLEGDLEKMNDKWNALKTKLFERERKLDVGLLQSGKFREALDSLAKWLSDTEEMVANQKPPSADYKVVKAQLQEQKFLKKLLFDRQHSMSSLLDMGHDLASRLEPKEKKDLEEIMQELVARFDALSHSADERMKSLNTAMSVAKEFWDQYSPIVDWLEKSEKKVREMEVVPTDEDKIQSKIEEHDLLHEEVVAKKPSFETLSDVASTLMALVGDDEANALADKLSDLTDRYAGLVEASDNLGQLLADAKQGLRHLVLSYEDLVAWMEDTENRLARYKVLSVYIEKLVEQMEEITDITEEVTAHQQHVDNVVDTGLELMRHISNEEALQLKDKLDSIHRRYNDLTARASDLLKNTQETLPLVQQFHESHGKLSEWLIDAESRLQALESGTSSGNVTAQEDEIMSLEADLGEVRPLLEVVNLTGPQLCQRARGEGATTIESLVQRDNRRFDSICEQIQRRGERLQLAKQRSMEVVGDLDDLLEWCRETESQLKEADQPSTDPDVIRVQLKEHKALNEDIASQKSRVRDALSASKKVIREQNDDSGMIREKMDDLKETMDAVVALSFDRLSTLEQALPLAEHFFEAHVELAQWIEEAEQDVAMLEAPALRADQIMKQQEVNKQLTAAVADHKPLVDKLNKSGTALVKLCMEEEAVKVQDLLDSDNSRYAGLRANLRERQQALEEALQETSQFADKLDGMLAALSSTADQIKSAEPISAHPDKLQEQIAENAAIVEDLEKRETAFETVKQAAEDVINKATSKNDPAVKDIKAKMDKLSKLWDAVVNATSERGKSLEEALAVAEKFWDELQNVLSALKDLQDTLSAQDPPAVEPGHIQQQKEVLQEIRSEIEQTKPDVENCKSTGLDLISLCGEQDKPEVKKHIEDLDLAWDNVTALFAKREENLIDAMEKAMEFHDTLRNILEFLEKAENNFAGMRPIDSELESVKEQIDQLKEFKADVDPAMVKVESLNRQAAELTERTSPDQAAALKEPLGRVNRRWEDLAKGIVERQRDLEHALLRLGQFQHALAELMVWINKTDGTLDELKPVFGDPAVIEVELAKLKVLVNDIQAHQNSVDTLNDAGRQLVESDRGSDDANRTQQKLAELNQNWDDLVAKASLRQKDLEDALKEGQMFHGDIQDLLLWLSDIDSALSTSKPVGGLPETAAEQLQRFMGVYDELEENRPKVETILQQGAEYLKRSNPGAASSLQHNLKTLKQRWDTVMNRANDKKIKLEIALKEATEFHDQLQAFVDWLTDAEKILTGLKPVSRVLETVTGQIDEHKAFQKDIGSQREIMLGLDKKGTHLKYFSQKQDVILIKNLLISVQHRWERVLTKAAERTRGLDHGYKEAKEFSDAYCDLNAWLDNASKAFDDAAQTLGKDPDKIKQLLHKHKEFQRALGAKQPTYDGTMRMGKMLKDRAPKTDEPAIKELMTDLKNKWQDVCNRSVDRQRKLEEGLLFSGQFKDALQALVDWLCKVDLPLMKDGPVHGDLDTVIALKEQHKNFEDEFSGRLSQANQVRKTATDLLTSANTDDAAAIKNQVKQLDESWNKVSEASRARSGRLDDALAHAEELHRRVNILLEWLSDGEMKLRFAGQLPEDQEECIEQIGDHKRFLIEMGEKEREKDDTLSLANDILSKCHPDAVTVIRHWITIIQSRWEEVSNWAKQREHRLEEHVRQLRDSAELLEELLDWLTKQETTLLDRDSEPLPEDIPTIQELVEEHNKFMEVTGVRTPEVDRVCKPKQQPKLSTTRKPSRKSITGLDRDFRRSVSREASPDYEPPSRRASQKPASRESTPGLVSPRKASQAVSDRSSPARDTSPIREYPKPWMTNVARSSPSRDGEELQHYGPRFPSMTVPAGMLRKGSKPSISEPVIKSPRAKQLWDKWHHVWVMAWDRQRRLNDRRGYLDDVEKVRHFSWDDWRRRFMRFMNGKKSRVTDLFRKMDKNNEGAIPREDFIDGIIRTKFPTSRLEMEAVANMFDRNSEGYIDWKEFMAALRPDWEEKPSSDAEKIHDEVKRQVQKCTCRNKFRVHQVGEGKYRFGESQKLRLVRILRSTVMVRVGGGWVALDEFLVKNDPCRAKGRTNVELREQFVLAEGVSQSLSPFKTRPNGSISGPSGGMAPPGRTSQSQSLPTAGPIMKIKEMTPKSFPMQQRGGRSSFSTAKTPDSSTSDDGSFRLHSATRKGSAPVRPLANSSQPSSRPASRNESRQNSRPPSRQNSNVSLDSVADDTSKSSSLRRTPSFQRGTGRPTTSTPTGRTPTTSTPTSYNSLPRRTATTRTRNPSGSSSGTPSGTPLNGTPASASRNRSAASSTSASSTPASTPLGSSRLVRKGSGASESPTALDRKGSTPVSGLRKPSNYTPKK